MWQAENKALYVFYCSKKEKKKKKLKYYIIRDVHFYFFSQKKFFLKQYRGAKIQTTFLTVNFFAILVHYGIKFALTLYIVFFVFCFFFKENKNRNKAGRPFGHRSLDASRFRCTAACLPSTNPSLSVSERFISQISPLCVCMYACMFLCFVWYEMLSGVRFENWTRSMEVLQGHLNFFFFFQRIMQWFSEEKKLHLYKFTALVEEAGVANKWDFSPKTFSVDRKHELNFV